MTYGEFFIGIIVYIVIVIIIAEKLYKRNKGKELGYDPFLEKIECYDRTNTYLATMSTCLITVLIVGFVIKVITNWNIEI